MKPHRKSRRRWPRRGDVGHSRRQGGCHLEQPVLGVRDFSLPPAAMYVIMATAVAGIAVLVADAVRRVKQPVFPLRRPSNF
ncbi:hypothetical protein [Pyrobaculum islandicum]|nr:hypothetical protein [Pyrobaculum islandicum]